MSILSANQNVVDDIVDGSMITARWKRIHFRTSGDSEICIHSQYLSSDICLQRSSVNNTLPSQLFEICAGVISEIGVLLKQALLPLTNIIAQCENDKKMNT